MSTRKRPSPSQNEQTETEPPVWASTILERLSVLEKQKEKEKEPEKSKEKQQRISVQQQLLVSALSETIQIYDPMVPPTEKLRRGSIHLEKMVKDVILEYIISHDISRKVAEKVLSSCVTRMFALFSFVSFRVSWTDCDMLHDLFEAASKTLLSTLFDDLDSFLSSHSFVFWRRV